MVRPPSGTPTPHGIGGVQKAVFIRNKETGQGSAAGFDGYTSIQIEGHRVEVANVATLPSIDW